MADLERLSDLVRAMADELAADEADEGLQCDPASIAQFPALGLAGVARHQLRLRRKRDSLLGKDLFADPAWDILLDLYANHAEGRRVSISSACIAAAVPATTALRWIACLEKRGLLARSRDDRDHRRQYLHLSAASCTAIECWLTASLGRGAA